jgi:hypothetical protein
MFPVAVSLLDGRRHKRHALGRTSPLQVETGGRFLCRVEDMSRSGARLSTFSALAPGTLVVVELAEDLSVEAEIVWADDFEAGCSFRRALDQSAFDRIIGAGGPAGHIPRH